MTFLARPDLRLRATWAAAVAEYAAAGETLMHGAGLWGFERVDTTADGAQEIVDHLLAQGDPATELAEDRVHCTYFWITDADPDADPEEEASAPEFVGYLALRHRLTAWLLEEGGHIGYSVRPARRREGHASRALALALPRAAALGLDRVLVTAKADNRPSQVVIERCGGVYEDTRNGMRRYWVPTAPSGPSGSTGDEGR